MKILSVLKLISLIAILMLLLFFSQSAFVHEELILLDASYLKIAQEKIAPSVFIGIYILALALFLPGTPFTIASGILFGPVQGTFYALIAITLGSLIPFGLSRLLGQAAVNDLLANKKWNGFDRMENTFDHHYFSLILFARLIPFVPFSLANLTLGLSRIPWHTYFFATLIGVVPMTTLYAWLGDALLSRDLQSVMLAMMILAIVSWLAWRLKRWYRNSHKRLRSII